MSVSPNTVMPKKMAVSGSKAPRMAVTELMLRDKKIENSQLPWE